MKFELHCHSHYSVGTKIVWEGLNSPREIVETAKRKGLDGVAITDHDSNRSWTEAERAAIREGIIFIKGIEISTNKGHVIGLGLNEHIKRDLGVEETIERIHEQGGIAIAPHPFDIKGDGVREMCLRADAVEVFNALNLDKLANNFTERKLRGVDIGKVCGSDAHSIEMLGHAVNHMDALDADSVLKQIVRGNVQMEKNYIPVRMITSWGKIRMERSYNYMLDYINEHYWGPKAWLAQGLLNKYVHSRRTKFWNAVGITSIGISKVYGSLKILSYY